tara:strand:- start:30 stop:539 length:510 start_codon:yes stop_codon:yes gene_type:complete
MKILAGQFKGQRIITKKNLPYRPTKSMVRKSIFDRLNPFNFSLVLDLFSGSGIFGFEAASRGANYVAFVEKNSKIMDLIKINSNNKTENINFSFYNGDAFKFLKSCNNFDLIFADPPYDNDYLEILINSCLSKLNRGGKFVLETSEKHSFSDNVKQIKFGESQINIWNN